MRVVYSAERINERLKEVANQIAEDYSDRELILVGMLKGAAFFLADLARMIPRPVDYEFVAVTSSIGAHGEVVSLTFATQVDVSDRHVLVLKDVFHSGVTENYLITHLSQQNPASMEVAALVDKPQLRSVNLNAKYAVFDDAPDGFLVGYGLGPGHGEHTNQPDLCVSDEEG
ncbi:MAG: hypoxanthine phosphoribosyltransferase [Acidobacteria bacterium]|jgi:hypoxanthine phosphoribosyltransferase|nr:hypoxanthine phosphoribosyltransferase [Acidobacteriota bacterium]